MLHRATGLELPLCNINIRCDTDSISVRDADIVRSVAVAVHFRALQESKAFFQILRDAMRAVACPSSQLPTGRGMKSLASLGQQPGRLFLFAARGEFHGQGHAGAGVGRVAFLPIGPRRIGT